MPSIRNAVLLLLPIAVLSAQQPTSKLHPFLVEQLRNARKDQQLPVYFVMQDKLDYDHWFPRVFTMPLAERRATVIAELRAQATRTQAELLDYLAAEVAAGNASAVSSNWLGNFVQCKATPLVVLTGAAVAAVSEVWFDYVPPLEQVQDDQPNDDCSQVLPSAPPPPAGNGPVAVFADRVWNLGFRGQGVVIANVDGGLTSHGDLNGRRWTNPGEIPGNGIDDDGDGLIDDVQGWAFDTNTANFDDGGGHGTNTSGVLVADGSCSSTTNGMAPQAQLITCRIANETDQWNGIQYGVLKGADLQTSSYSFKSYFTPPPNYKMHRDVAQTSLAAGLIRTNSTSNDGGLCNSGTSPGRKPINISAPGCVPCPYLDPNQTLRGQLGGVLGVAAWDFTLNTLKSYSPCGPFAWYLADLRVNVPTYPAANWDAVHHNDYPWQGNTQQGLLKPDVSAPTDTTTTGAGPCSSVVFSGTSNATPAACGVIALWKSANPNLTPEDVAMIVHQTARDRGAVPGKENNWGAGVIDAEAGLYRALCVHRVDGQPQWTVDHPLAAGPVQLAFSGVPSSPTGIVVGLQRLAVPFGPVTVGVGATFGSVFVGSSNSSGDASVALAINSSLVGLTVYTQAFTWDLTYTNRILASNVIGVTIRP